MTGQRVSLDQQIEEIAQAMEYVAYFEKRSSRTDFRRRRLRAAQRTLEWIKTNEGDIRSFIEARKAAIKVEDAA